MSNYSLDITSLHKAYNTGELTPAKVVHDCLAKIRSTTKTTNAWIHILSDEEVGVYLNKLQSKPKNEAPLWGIPFAVKDNIDLENCPSTAACPAYSYPAKGNAFVVQKLIDAGAIPLGKTNMDQFATGLVGTRSPYGEVCNALFPEYVSGGSSSGSGHAVSSGHCTFSLGTDTAGSGRMPAAFNNIWGVKPTKGLLSTSGVIPACRSLDCVSIFGVCPEDCRLLLNVASAFDSADPYSRHDVLTGLPTATPHIGVPRASQLAFFGNEEYAAQFEHAKEQMRAAGAQLIEIDFEPFLTAAKLLYEGPWVAERTVMVGDFIKNHPDACLDVTKKIILGGYTLTATDAFRGFYALQACRLQAEAQLARVDAVLTPTAGTIFRREQIREEPIKLNSQLGTYTNFMNLLDLAALAFPAGFTPSGLPFGVTLFAPAFTDERLLDIAALFSHKKPLPVGASKHVIPISAPVLPGKEYVSLVVCGAHMLGQPLNEQLTSRGGRFVSATDTAKCYRFYALSGRTRPGLVRVSAGGEAISVEVWALPARHVGAILASVPAPLALGHVQLASGEWLPGFVCEAVGAEGATDITQLADWRKFKASH